MSTLIRQHMYQLDSPTSNGAIDNVLESMDGYIRALAESKVPRTVVPPEILDLEIDEIVQNTRIKLWQTFQRRQIINLRIYTRCIVYTEVVNIVRRYKYVLPLPINEDGELYQGKILISPGQGMQDPADELEREEALADWLVEIVDEVLALPQCQRQAMMSVLKDWAADIFLLTRILVERGVDIERMEWPEEKEGLQRLRASRSIARRKLRSLRGI